VSSRTRALQSEDAERRLEARLAAFDEDAHRLSYALLTDTPFRDRLTTVTVHDLGPYQAELAWPAKSNADGLPESEAADLLKGALAASCLALMRFVEAGGE